ncbi:SCO family protein [Bacillus massilinigeriensis]|uniref:SCO family protein n=1 Tax=Bacillus mediterraneensis TaxID=1805474 RepID=UPI0008F8641A|nr:SCO family protein [Bacillus mediterraneensis]
MRAKWLALPLMILIFIAGCGDKGIENPLNYEIKDFTFTNQEDKPFGLKDLKGKIWVADFIFTSCDTICPPMTANMLKLQDMVKEEKLKNVEFVSFSVDPTVDNPKILKDYSEKFHVDTKNWSFLTGYSQEEIETFAMDNFKTLVKKPETGDQVVHQSYFFLVDQEGKIMKSYSGSKEVPFDDILKDIKSLD